MGWMKARLGFSSQVVMQKLIEHIAADVNEWQAASEENHAAVNKTDMGVIITRSPRDRAQCVRLDLRGNEIEILTGSGQGRGYDAIGKVTPRLQESGEWHFVTTDGAVLHELELRRLALEGLLFGCEVQWGAPRHR
jgi:hypothetical protein